MRRILFTWLAVGVVGAAVPAAAIARHGDDHHRHHRGRVRHARVHRSRVRHERFGRSEATTTSSSSDNAGTVTSFTGGILTVKLTDGSRVSGRVTGATEIECSMPASSAGQSDLRRDGDRGDASGAAGNEDNGDREEAGEDNGEEAQSCGTGALTSRTTVREAELTVSSAGAIWHKVELLTQL